MNVCEKEKSNLNGMVFSCIPLLSTSSFFFSFFLTLHFNIAFFFITHWLPSRLSKSFAWSAIVPSPTILLLCSFPTPLTLVHQRLHIKMGFKVHVGWTQLATLVAVDTRLTHGQVVENSGSGSLRGCKGLSRFVDFTVQLYRPSGALCTRRKNNMHADAEATRRSKSRKKTFYKKKSVYPFLVYRRVIYLFFSLRLK